MIPYVPNLPATSCLGLRNSKKLSGLPLASPRKLGLLAGIFEDGTLSVYVVPYPPDLASTERLTKTSPIYGRLVNACNVD